MKHPITPEMKRRHVVALGKTRSGKTTGMKGSIEESLDDGEQVVVFDPTSAWYGLRLGRDGKTPMYPSVLIVGGEYADVPLVPDAASARALADVIFDQRISVVLDVAGLAGSAMIEWATAFATQFYKRSNKAQPITVVVDEAHEFCPKDAKMGPKVGDMMYAFRRLATAGGSRGLRIVAITQRPAKLHNDYLSSVDTIVAFRTVWPSDRKVIADVISGSGDKAKEREVLDSLANLKPGEGWIWDTDQGTVERVKFPPIKTYDSSATPVGKGLARVELGKVDREAIGRLLEAAGDRIRADDPKALRAEIDRLEREITAQRDEFEAAAPAESKANLDAAFERGHRVGEQLGWDACAEMMHGVRAIPDRLRAVIAEIGELEVIPKLPTRPAGESEFSATKQIPDRPPGESLVFSASQSVRPIGNGFMAAGPIKLEPHELTDIAKGTERHRVARRPVSFSRNGEAPTELAPRQVRMLSAGLWLETKLRRLPTRQQLGVLLGVRFDTGTFESDLGRLRSSGLVDYPQSGVVEVTETGAMVATSLETKWSLRAGMTKLLEPRHIRTLDLLEKHRSGLSREDIGKALGVKHNTGTFESDLGKLRTLTLLEYPSKGHVRLCDWVRSLP